MSLWCSGSHVRFTRERSWVRSPPGLSFLPPLTLFAPAHLSPMPAPHQRSALLGGSFFFLRSLRIGVTSTMRSCLIDAPRWLFDPHIGVDARIRVNSSHDLSVCELCVKGSKKELANRQQSSRVASTPACTSTSIQRSGSLSGDRKHDLFVRLCSGGAKISHAVRGCSQGHKKKK